jgi:hypothetical protein
LPSHLAAEGDAMSDLSSRVKALEMVLVEIWPSARLPGTSYGAAASMVTACWRVVLCVTGPVQRRSDPTPDKINEAFKRAARC